MHPAGPRCSSVTYAQYAPSSRRVPGVGAPRRSRCDAGFHHGLLYHRRAGESSPSTETCRHRVENPAAGGVLTRVVTGARWRPPSKAKGHVAAGPPRHLPTYGRLSSASTARRSSLTCWARMDPPARTGSVLKPNARPAAVVVPQVEELANDFLLGGQIIRKQPISVRDPHRRAVRPDTACRGQPPRAQSELVLAKPFLCRRDVDPAAAHAPEDSQPGNECATVSASVGDVIDMLDLRVV